MSEGFEPTWGYTDESSQLMVKPIALPCKYSPQFCQQVLVADDSEYITILVGAKLDNSELLLYVFGVESAEEMKQQQTLPAYCPAEESPEA